MPELPELELLSETLTRYLGGKTIRDVVLNPARAFVIRHPAQDFAEKLHGRVVSDVRRRGKFLLFGFLDGGEQLIINPMLSGRFAYCSRAAPKLAATCFTLGLDGGDEMRFLDATMMARVYLTSDPNAEVPTFAELGPDACDPGLDFAAFSARLRKHRGEIKNVLRNQAFIAGIGNAYADEILWEARVRPLRRTSTLDESERAALYAAVRSVLSDATRIVKQQYAERKHPLHKQDRSFLNVHAKGKAICPRCDHRISSIHSGGESTFFCRGCQV